MGIQPDLLRSLLVSDHPDSHIFFRSTWEYDWSFPARTHDRLFETVRHNHPIPSHTPKHPCPPMGLGPLSRRRNCLTCHHFPRSHSFSQPRRGTLLQGREMRPFSPCASSTIHTHTTGKLPVTSIVLMGTRHWPTPSNAIR
jgi:hypothetical protein